MISCTCRTALSTVARQRPVLRFSARNFSSSSSILASPPAPSSSQAGAAGESAPSSTTPSLSSCPEGTVLKGLNYLKDESPILSKPDSEYPSWLWSLASDSSAGEGAKKSVKKGKGGTSVGEEELRVQELARQKKSLKMEGRKAIKANNVLRG
ncbi:mitochondrial 54S ribosomal protein mL54 MRPL37 [Sporobolomyces salmoneus]|uniref:mitochondrial 54S ribosomal protein mL54 MRPL37 n=1 Tax=Sporobolomyces salmoneus TaxID=183962 RepID=UPI00317A20A3